MHLPLPDPHPFQLARLLDPAALPPARRADYLGDVLARGATDVTLHQSRRDGFLVLELIAPFADDGLTADTIGQAEARARELVADLTARVAASPEGRALAEATAAHEVVGAEMAAARDRLADLRARRAADVAAGVDVRPLRPLLAAAEAEVEDLTPLLESRAERRKAAFAAYHDRLRTEWWKTRSPDLAALDGRRAALEVRVSEFAREAAAELYAIERASRSLRRDRPLI